MAATKERVVHVLYTDDYDWEREQYVRREIASGTYEEFDEIRGQLKDLRSIRRDDLAKRETERYVETYMQEESRRDWNDFKAELATFDGKREKERCGYIILREDHHYREGLPAKRATLRGCIDFICNTRGSYELTFQDVDGRFTVKFTQGGSVFYHIVELVDDSYEEEIEDEDGVSTEAGYIDGEYLYRLGHPDTPASELDRFLREKCREVGFWKRHWSGEPVSDTDFLIVTVP